MPVKGAWPCAGQWRESIMKVFKCWLGEKSVIKKNIKIIRITSGISSISWLFPFNFKWSHSYFYVVWYYYYSCFANRETETWGMRPTGRKFDMLGVHPWSLSNNSLYKLGTLWEKWFGLVNNFKCSFITIAVNWFSLYVYKKCYTTHRVLLYCRKQSLSSREVMHAFWEQSGMDGMA